MAADPDERAAGKAALELAKSFVEDILTDETVRRFVARSYVEQLVREGHLVPREALTAVEGLQLVPKGTLEAARAELDDLRVLIAEHLDGADRSDRLREVLEGPTALNREYELPPPTQATEPAPKAKKPEKVEPKVEAEPEVEAEDEPEREARRRGKMPPPGTPCARCGGPVPAEGDRPDQASLSYARWREILCGTCHREQGAS